MKGIRNILNVPVVFALVALANLFFVVALDAPRALAQTSDSAAGSGDAASPESGAAPDGAAAVPDTAAAEAGASEEAAAEDAEGEVEEGEGEVAAAETVEVEPASDDDASALASGSGTSEDAAEEDEDDIDRARSEEEAEAAQAASEPLAWRNSFFSWTMGSTFNTFYRGADLSYNPLYYWAFSFMPRWYFSSNVFLVLNQGLYYELTNDDGATYNHEPQLYDTVLDLRATFVVDRFIFIPTVRLTLPASKLSQAAQRYFQTGIGLTAVLNMPEVASGNLALVLRYGRWWGETNVSRTLGASPTSTTGDTGTIGGFAPNGSAAGAGTGGDAFGDAQADGTTVGVDILTMGLSWNLTPIEGWTITLSGFLLFVQGNTLAEPTVGVMGNPMVETLEDSRPHWRAFSSYSLQLAYDVQPWFNLGLGISNATNLSPFWGQDGNVYSPFNPNTQVYLTATVTLDGIYETLTAGGENDGLTPEERQRRRQGLAELDEELLEDVLTAPVVASDAAGDGPTADDDTGTGATRATGAF